MVFWWSCSANIPAATRVFVMFVQQFDEIHGSLVHQGVMMYRTLLAAFGGCVVALQVLVTIYVAMIWLQPGKSSRYDRFDHQMARSMSRHRIGQRDRV